MTRTRAEIKQLGKNLVTSVLATVIGDFPKVAAAIHKINKEEWTDCVDQLIEQTEDCLLSNIACSD